jgi:chromosome segregation and condensation protein ScpB
MSEKFERQPGPGSLEFIKPKENMSVRQVLEIMKKEGLRPVTLKELMEALGHDQNEIDETVKAIEESYNQEKEK